MAYTEAGRRSDPAGGRYLTAAVLSLVCKHWRGTALSCAGFWSDLMLRNRLCATDARRRDCVSQQGNRALHYTGAVP